MAEKAEKEATNITVLENTSSTKLLANALKTTFDENAHLYPAKNQLEISNTFQHYGFILGLSDTETHEQQSDLCFQIHEFIRDGKSRFILSIDGVLAEKFNDFSKCLEQNAPKGLYQDQSAISELIMNNSECTALSFKIDGERRSTRRAISGTNPKQETMDFIAKQIRLTLIENGYNPPGPGDS